MRRGGSITAITAAAAMIWLAGPAFAGCTSNGGGQPSGGEDHHGSGGGWEQLPDDPNIAREAETRRLDAEARAAADANGETYVVRRLGPLESKDLTNQITALAKAQAAAQAAANAERCAKLNAQIADLQRWSPHNDYQRERVAFDRMRQMDDSKLDGQIADVRGQVVAGDGSLQPRLNFLINLRSANAAGRAAVIAHYDAQLEALRVQADDDEAARQRDLGYVQFELTQLNCGGVAATNPSDSSTDVASDQ